MTSSRVVNYGPLQALCSDQRCAPWARPTRNWLADESKVTLCVIDEHEVNSAEFR